jgi:hypothetical protein
MPGDRSVGTIPSPSLINPRPIYNFEEGCTVLLMPRLMQMPPPNLDAERCALSERVLEQLFEHQIDIWADYFSVAAANTEFEESALNDLLDNVQVVFLSFRVWSLAHIAFRVVLWVTVSATGVRTILDIVVDLDPDTPCPGGALAAAPRIQECSVDELPQPVCLEITQQAAIAAFAEHACFVTDGAQRISMIKEMLAKVLRAESGAFPAHDKETDADAGTFGAWPKNANCRFFLSGSGWRSGEFYEAVRLYLDAAGSLHANVFVNCIADAASGGAPALLAEQCRRERSEQSFALFAFGEKETEKYVTRPPDAPLDWTIRDKEVSQAFCLPRVERPLFTTSVQLEFNSLEERMRVLITSGVAVAALCDVDRIYQFGFDISTSDTPEHTTLSTSTVNKAAAATVKTATLPAKKALSRAGDHSRRNSMEAWLPLAGGAPIEVDLAALSRCVEARLHLSRPLSTRDPAVVETTTSH